MKKEDRIISSLFEEARTEVPKVSFEEMAQRFVQQLPVSPAKPAGLSTTLKQLLLKHIGLNTIILVIGAGLVYQGLKPSTPTPEIVAIPPVVMAEDSVPSASPILPIAQPLIQTPKTASPSPTLLSATELQQKRQFRPLSPRANPSKQDSTMLAIEDSLQSASPSTQAIPDAQAMDSMPLPASEAAQKESPQPASTDPGFDSSAVPQAADSLLMSGFTIRDKVKIDTTDIYTTTPIILKNTYNQDATREFFTLLSSYGFKLKKKRYRFKDGLVKNISLHLTHEKGLDFRLKAVRFRQLEFKLYFDQADQLYGFSVCMNNNHEKVEKIISLNATGHITRQYRY